MAESITGHLLRSAHRSAIHLETRDGYTPHDPDWTEWRSGRRFDPVDRWRDWFDLMSQTTARGVQVRRARVVSEPISAYVRFEYDVTSAHNIGAGEQVRWLGRKDAIDLLIPAVDFWVIDEQIVVVNHFDGEGDWVGEERRDSESLARQLTTAFDAIWARATDHAAYHPD